VSNAQIITPNVLLFRVFGNTKSTDTPFAAALCVCLLPPSSSHLFYTLPFQMRNSDYRVAWTTAAAAATVIGGLSYCYHYKVHPLFEKLSQVGISPWRTLLQVLRCAFVRPILLEARVEEETEAISLTVNEALLIFFPDDRVPPEAYIDLAQLIQQKASAQQVRLHVGIARFGINRPSAFWGESDAHANVFVLLQKVNKRRRRSNLDNIILFGHGKGTETLLRKTPYTALIRFGSLTGLNYLDSYPKPCLTLLGDQDRHVPFTQLASQLEQVDTIANNSNDNIPIPIPKPVLLLPGLNHVCLVNPKHAKAYLVHQNDLPLTSNTFQRETALDLVACVSTNFIRIVLGGNAAEVCELTQLSRFTQRHLNPYRALMSREAQIDFVQRLQQHIYRYDNGTSRNPLPPISVHFPSNLNDFVYAKPKMGHDFLQTFFFEAGPLHIKNGHVLLTSPTWVIKCRSRQALLTTYSYSQQRTPITSTDDDNFAKWTHVFQQWNQQTFDHVLRHVVTDQERSRFVQRGLRLEFGPDQQFMKRSSLPWIFTDLIVYENPANRTLHVVTPVGYTTNNSRTARKFRGSKSDFEFNFLCCYYVRYLTILLLPTTPSSNSPVLGWVTSALR
jgi:hypothetical protein